MQILAQLSDLVATVAAEFGVPTAVLAGLLEPDGGGDRDASKVDGAETPVAGSECGGVPTMGGASLRLASLTTENLFKASSVLEGCIASCGASLEEAPPGWSLPDVLKLLLIGTGDEDVRTVGFPPQRLSRHEFVLGAPGSWPGLVQPDPASGMAITRIHAVFEGDGIGFSVERTWRFEAADWTEEVYVREGARCLVGRDAIVWLKPFLPPELIPLFAYDASDVLALLLSPLRRKQALDRLYPSAFLATLSSSVRTERMSAERLAGIRRSTVEIAEVRRRQDHALRMREQARSRIRSLENEFAAAQGTRDRLSGSTRLVVPRPSDSRRRGPPIAIPEPLSAGGSHADGERACGGHPSDGCYGTSGRLAARLVDLQVEIDDLQSRIKAARDAEHEWARLLEACSWKLRAFVAEEALALTSRPANAGEADRLEKCLGELSKRLRDRTRNVVRDALHRYAPLLDLPAGCTCKLGLDDQDNLRLDYGPRPSDGIGAFIEERAAFLLMRALQEASGSPIPVFAVLDRRQVHERNWAWLETRYVSWVCSDTIFLTSSGPRGDPDGGRMRIEIPLPVGVEP